MSAGPSARGNRSCRGYGCVLGVGGAPRDRLCSCGPVDPETSLCGRWQRRCLGQNTVEGSRRTQCGSAGLSDKLSLGSCGHGSGRGCCSRYRCFICNSGSLIIRSTAFKTLVLCIALLLGRLNTCTGPSVIDNAVGSTIAAALALMDDSRCSHSCRMKPCWGVAGGLVQLARMAGQRTSSSLGLRRGLDNSGMGKFGLC
jgi:hypothetical protein